MDDYQGRGWRLDWSDQIGPGANPTASWLWSLSTGEAGCRGFGVIRVVAQEIDSDPEVVWFEDDTDLVVQ